MVAGAAYPKAFGRRRRGRADAETCARSASAPFPQSLGPLSVAALRKGDQEASPLWAPFSLSSPLRSCADCPGGHSAQRSWGGGLAQPFFGLLRATGSNGCLSKAAVENPVPRAVRRLVKALKPDLVAVELDEVGLKR